MMTIEHSDFSSSTGASMRRSICSPFSTPPRRRSRRVLKHASVDVRASASFSRFKRRSHRPQPVAARGAVLRRLLGEVELHEHHV